MEPEAIAEKLRTCILEALPDAKVSVTIGSPGHYSLEVISPAFEGQNTLTRQRAVYSAIAPWMAGNDAPVHAIDQMITKAGA